MRHIIVALLALWWCFGFASANELGRGALPLKVDAVKPLSLERDDEIVVEGVVDSKANVVVVLRIDDMQSWSYASRFNGERTVPPGPFRWRIGANGLRTASGRYLDPGALRRMILFLGKGDGIVNISTFEIRAAERLPDGAKGYSLGAREAEIPVGFERIAPGDDRIVGGKVFAVSRPAPDPLVASGVRGIERLRLPWAPGYARVTVWSEDPGEWELLPHPLERRIRVNGIDVLYEGVNPSGWIEGRYLAGSRLEHNAGDDAWSAFGAHRGNARSVDVVVGNDGIVVELAGQGAEALFLSAVLVEPKQGGDARKAVEAARADWYRSRWPIVTTAGGAPKEPIRIISSDPARAVAMMPLRASGAPGTGIRLSLEIGVETNIPRPDIRLGSIARGSATLGGLLWGGQRRLERRHASDTVLALGDNMLVGELERLPLQQGVVRSYELWVEVPETAPSGRYRGEVTIGGDDGTALAVVPIEVDVLEVRLPPVAKSVGFYLDEAPHLTWFAATAADRSRQAMCDLRLMARFGLTGSAPAFATPRERAGLFEADVGRALEVGMSGPWLAYAPAKRLLAGLGIHKSAEMLARIEGEMRAAGQPPPVWSVADEPSNPDNPETGMRTWINAIRERAPSARLAGHLNNPSDRRLAGLFDVAVINAGYGVDGARIADLVRDGREVWLYNTGHHRATAGLWLWRTDARRYVQWHARMPTADPFDPTDGREGDVQMLFPDARVCAAVPTIHRDLLEMAEGVVDQRWLLWLDAQDTPSARALARRLKEELAESWGKVAALSREDLQTMRESIMQLARVTR